MDAARQRKDYSGTKQIGVDETSKAKGHIGAVIFNKSIDLLMKCGGAHNAL